jgi:exosortase/archaeosortase family protein
MSATLAVSPGGAGESFPSRRASVAPRILAAVAVTAAAYHYSLSTLVRNLGVDSPLAYLGLVPFIALAMAASRGVIPASEPAIHDRELDYIVGIPLVVGAVAIAYALPARLSTMFWVWRIDLLSLPLFAAGTVALVFGVRALWRMRAAIAFLLLAWPLPYTTVLDRWLAGFTNVTIAALRLLVGRIPVAAPVSGQDGSLFAISHAGRQFVVSVASACSGANGMVGFILVGVAFIAVVKGRRLPKAIWLLGGTAVLWLLNLGRILLIFAVGQRWGEHAAIDSFHPYIGLVVFNIGVALMILVMPVFGLHVRGKNPSARTADGGPASRVAAGGTEHIRRAVPHARVAVILLMLAAGTLGVANSGLARYGLVASELGKPRLVGFSQSQGRLAGWSDTQSESFTAGLRFFGETSTWKRFLYLDNTALPASQLRSSAPVIADVISTPDLHSLSVYGVEACYNFHGYKIQYFANAGLGAGITASLITYHHPKLGSDWTTLYWHWPVVGPGGKTRYERVVLMMIDGADAQVASRGAPASGNPAPAAGVKATSELTNAQAEQTRQFLVGFAQALVRAQASTGASSSPTSGATQSAAPGLPQGSK